MITTLIFDLGGVIINHRQDLMPYIIARVFHLSSESARAVWHEHKNALLTGELPSVAFIDKIRKQLHVSVPPDTLLERWKTMYESEAREINNELLEAIDRLKKKYAVYLLTDTLDVHHWFNESRGLYAHFHGVFSSHTEGRSKSQGKDVFGSFLAKFHLRAVDCVFIDDMEAYVALAKSLNIQSFVYTSVVKLKKDLRSIGVIF